MSLFHNKKERPPFGVMTLAMGEYYQDLALVLLESLRRYMPDLKVAVVTDNNEEKLSEYFDYVIPLDLAHGTTLKQKLFLNDYSPFAKTMFIDADTIALRSFQDFIDQLIDGEYPFTSNLVNWSPTRNQKSGWVLDPILLEKKTGFKDFCCPHGGLYFWDQEKGQKWFLLAREFYEKFDETYGLKNETDHGYNEEIAFGCAIISFKEQNGFDYYFPPNGNLMTTSYHSRMKRSVFGDLVVRRRGSFIRKENPSLFHFFHNNTKKPLYQSIKKKAFTNLPSIKVYNK